ncbi:glyoxalase superfamily protein [Salmonella enterica]
MNNDNLLCARIEALKLTAVQDSIKQAITGFVVEEQLDIAELKLHAHVLRKKLQAEGTTLKTTHAQELVACKHGFSNWQAAIARLKS